MPYSPREPPNMEDLDDVITWVTDELRAIAGELRETIELELRLRGAAPTKPREGMIVAADGTNWNPGGGKGIYAYLGTAWVKLS